MILGIDSYFSGKLHSTCKMRMWAFIICECGISVGILGCVHDNRLAFYTPEMIPIVRRIFQIPFIKLSSIEHFYEKNVNMYVRSHALNCQIEIQIHDLFCMFTQIHPKINTKRQKMMTEKMNKTQSRIDGYFFSTPHLLRRPRFVYKIFFPWKNGEIRCNGEKCMEMRSEEIFVLTETAYVHTIFWCFEFWSSKGNHIHGTVHRVVVVLSCFKLSIPGIHLEC